MILGLLLIANFLLVWAVPLFLQGIIFHQTFVGAICRSAYEFLSPGMNHFLRCVYRNSKHTEYGCTAVLVLLSTICNFLFYTNGRISAFTYTLGWVGIGGRCMGGAYTFAHKEAHNPLLYKYKINVFENWVGLLYGNVPNNFSTSHIYIHHALDGRKGDTFYMWDLPRNSFFSFATYVERVFWHMCAITPVQYFRSHNMYRQSNKLIRGCIAYWILFPSVLAMLTTSKVLFVVWLQPLFAMTVFLALINWAQHGFIELDSNGCHDPRVNATTIVDGRDDYFAENYHWEHHYTHDQPSADDTLKPASVFTNISIPELALLILFDKFEMLSKHTTIDVEVMRYRAHTTE